MIYNKIIFILYNIFETKSGVSNKYLSFINYLKNNNIEYNLITTNIYEETINKNNDPNIIFTKGCVLPFYKNIKVPFLKKKEIIKLIQNKNEIIIFNAEFIWLHSMLINIKKENQTIKLYPNLHTDYQKYLKLYFDYDFLNSKFIYNEINEYLKENIFDGIITTGEKNKKDFLQYTNNVFNANEIDLSVFSENKYDYYDSTFFNIFFCGRISIEKNIDETLEILYLLNDKNEKYDFLFHIIGDGPYKNDLIKKINLNYSEIKHKIKFYGELEPHDIQNLYMSLPNRIFIQTSITETFGKTPIEAGSSGIILFIKRSDITNDIYIDRKNAFLFDSPDDFLNIFNVFIKIPNKQKIIFDTINNSKKYDQKIIFSQLINFLFNDDHNNFFIKTNKIFNHKLFESFSRVLQCSGDIFSE